MSYRTVGLILAAGEGTRVRSILEEDEPVKGMIKIGNSRLIDLAIDFLDGAPTEIAVLSFPSEEYSTLEKRVNERGLRILHQQAKHKKISRLLELPYILIMQYFFSKNKEYFRGFDSILTMPSDLVYENVDIGGMVRFHNSKLGDPLDSQITILSKRGVSEGRRDLFKMDGDRIVGMRKYKGQEIGDYEVSTQAGIYIFSKGILRNPLRVLFKFKYNRIFRYLTSGTWVDYGSHENVVKARDR
ncbi:MAG: hypothetical protein O6939_00210 [Bacteroidetes bacterium]|nr:hypothetical protein [Bacteroidota bacterium]